MLLCTFVCKFLYGHTVSFLGVELLGHIVILGFPGSSAGKESACNAGDPGLIPGSGRFPGEGIGYPLQNSWASLVAQMVKNPLAKREMQDRLLGWEDPRRRAWKSTPVFLSAESPWTEEPGRL